MPHITTCTTCGLLYEESSEECADARVRECLNCFMEARHAELESPEPKRMTDDEISPQCFDRTEARAINAMNRRDE